MHTFNLLIHLLLATHVEISLTSYVWTCTVEGPDLCDMPHTICDSSCSRNEPVSLEMLCAFHRLLQDRKHSGAVG